MKIKSLTRRAISEPVYNFHCLPDENYFSENILVHNCYKRNTPTGRTMSLDTFKKIISKTLVQGNSSFLTQIAFGADAGAKYNPDLFLMMEHAKSFGIIPNITVANISDEVADKLASHCGAVAVSNYGNGKIKKFFRRKRLPNSYCSRI